jgi:hypothetical protein
MSEKQTGTVIGVKGEYFLETKDPNNARKKIVVPLNSLPGYEKLEPAVGKQVTVFLSEPKRYIAYIDFSATKIPIPNPVCYIPAPEFYARMTIDRAAAKIVARDLLARKDISEALYNEIVK